MALLAAHLTKVALKHTTHNPVIEHIGKEAVRQVGRRARRETLRVVRTHGKQSTSIKSAKGFNPRAARISTRGAAMRQSRSAGMGRGGYGAPGGFAGGFGGFHGK